MVNERYSYNLILLGGTGARCGEIFVHMCANGYFTGRRVNILYIDSDTDNGNANSMRELVRTYCACREKYMIKESPVPCFFKTEINLEEVNPVQGLNHFSDLIHLEQTDREEIRATSALMHALYSDEECDMKISDGFFARPNVGSAVFAANMDKILKDFLTYVRNDQKDLKKIKIFMIGSIFGGTGASSLPTISKYLKTKLYGESTDKLIGDKLKIGGSMLLPYFAFSRDNLKKKKDKGEVEIEAEKFSTKTKAALEYYKSIDQEEHRKVFDALYILGHDGHDVRGMYETSGSAQKNLPHIVEFYSAISAVTFFENNEMNEGKFFAVVPTEKIEWGNMYKGTKCFFSFTIMMRFSLFLKSIVLEEMFERHNGQWNRRKNAANIPWYHDFIDGRSSSTDLDLGDLGSRFYDISDYCNRYVEWFAELFIKNLEKKDKPDTIDFTHHVKRENDGEEDDDLVDYLNMFSEELLIKQYMNILIEKGMPQDYLEEAKKEIREQNIKFIRRHSPELSERRLFDDYGAREISFEKIWERLCDLGFNSRVKTESAVKNISKATPRTMDVGVRNLINAIYIACMI